MRVTWLSVACGIFLGNSVIFILSFDPQRVPFFTWFTYDLCMQRNIITATPLKIEIFVFSFRPNGNAITTFCLVIVEPYNLVHSTWVSQWGKGCAMGVSNGIKENTKMIGRISLGFGWAHMHQETSEAAWVDWIDWEHLNQLKQPPRFPDDLKGPQFGLYLQQRHS